MVVFETVSSISEGNGSSASIPVPTGVQEDDIIIAGIYKENTDSVTRPTGFSEIGTFPRTTGTVTSLHLFWKRATGNDSGSYSFSWSGSVWRGAAAMRISGVRKTGNPHEAFDTANRSSNSVTTPAVSVTTLGPDRLLVWAGTNYADTTWTPPSGFTERYDGDVLSFATADRSSAGPTGNITGQSANSSYQNAFLLALVPESSAGGRFLPFLM